MIANEIRFLRISWSSRLQELIFNGKRIHENDRNTHKK